MSMNKPERSSLERLFNLFSEVKKGEGTQVLLMAVNIFLLMTSYYIIKPAREALILAEEGAVAKSYLMAVMALLLMALVPLYSKLADRLGRNQLIGGVTAFFIACMVLFWGLSQFQVPRLGIAFFVWIGIFNVMIIAQFWSFANDLCSNEKGKRLFPVIAAGGSIGAALGSWIAGQFLEFVGVYELLLVSAGILTACIGLTIKIDRMDTSTSAGDTSEESQDSSTRSNSVGFDLVLKHKYLGLIAVLVLLLNLVNTNGEYIIGQFAEDHFRAATHDAVTTALAENQPLVFGSWEGDPTSLSDQKEFLGRSLGSFYSTFFFYVNILAIFLQLFLVSRLVRYGGIRAALLMLPLIAFGTYGLILAVPVFGYAWVGKTLENSTDYSVNNTVRHMLFLPTSREIKYKAKQVVDSFMHRLGDLISAAVVFGGTWYSFSMADFAALNLLVILAWVGVVWAIIRLHRKLENGELPELNPQILTDDPQIETDEANSDSPT
jgi:AAA family ATP:ADP antiporter